MNIHKNDRLTEFLFETTWFQSVHADARDRVLQDVYESAHLPSEVVARKGERAASWIGVVEGLLKVSDVHRNGKPIIFTSIPASGWIGEGTILKRELRRYDIVAVSRTRTAHLPSSTFKWLIDTCLDFNHVVMERLNERVSQFIGMMDIDRIDDPVARVARAIGTLYNPILSPNLAAELPLSQSELGEMIGVSRQTVSSALKRLQDEGLLSMRYGHVLILQVRALQNYAECEGG
jgi:CRP-like cAMP-binding protein